MMENLFSIFDPSISIFSMNWIILILSMTIISVSTKKLQISNFLPLKKVMMNLKKEMSFTLKKTEKGTENMIVTLFLLILLVNFIALYPQIFSASSHLAVTLPLSLIFWLTIMMFGWKTNTKHMLGHLLPQGTPPALMNFMVLIELTSNLIRPITLCVRLTANMIAGHLLISLLGSCISSIQTELAISLLPGPLSLMVLESAVAVIQAYVFMTLITLYITEIK